MLTKRIIPCLDIKDGKTVKGLQFEQIREMGDPITLAAYYAREGADELVLLDITATQERRKTWSDLVEQVARTINIPFTVGGGISAVADVQILLESGADKVSINSSAVNDPKLISDIAARYGSQCVVVAIDSKWEDDDWYVYINGGKKRTGMRTLDWAKQAAACGAGEILLTAISNDGTKKGFACAHTCAVSELVSIPVIASGGAGNEAHFAEVFQTGKADAALAAGIFHAKELSIGTLKQYLSNQGINVRYNKAMTF